MKPAKTKPTISFNTRLLAPKANSFTVLALPKKAKLPPGKIMVEGIINSFPFRAALEPDDKGNHHLKITKAMGDALEIKAGDTVAVEITRVGDEPEIRVPIDLQKALAASKRAKESWAGITPMARRDWIFSICTAKQAETRQRRIEKACSMLTAGKRRLCCFPGIKWMMEKNAKSCGMWVKLIDVKK